MPAGHKPGGSRLRRELGTRDLTFFAITCIVGTRWIAAAAAAGPGSIILWFAGAALFSVPLAIAVGSLTVRHPEAGGMYVWARADYGPWHGFLCFWLYWISVLFWFPGAALFYIAMALGPAANNRITLIGASLAAIWVALAFNIVGVKTGRWTQIPGTAANWILAALLGLAALIVWRQRGAATTFHLLPALTWDTVAFWSVIAFAMSGMELVGVMGGEIRDPQRSVPRAAMLASIVTTIFYAGATAAMLVLLRPEQVTEMNGLNEAGAAAARALGASWIPALFALLVLASAIGQFGAGMASASRLPFAAGVDGLLPEAFSRLHPKWATPWLSMLMLGAAASALLIAIQIGDTALAAYRTLVSLMVIVGFLPYVYIFGSAWKAGHRASAAIGLSVTLLAIVCSVIPTAAIQNVWTFEIKLLLGTAASIGSAWMVYNRRAVSTAAASFS